MGTLVTKNLEALIQRMELTVVDMKVTNGVAYEILTDTNGNYFIPVIEVGDIFNVRGPYLTKDSLMRFARNHTRDGIYPTIKVI